MSNDTRKGNSGKSRGKASRSGGVQLTGILGRLFFGIVMATVVIWGGYHFYNYYNDTLQYEYVFDYEVPRRISGTGIVIRDEMPIEDAPIGAESFLFDDAERVALGQTVAEYHQHGSMGSDIRRLRDIEREIAMLEQAQDYNVNNISNADAINRDIRERLGVMVNIAATGRCRELESVREDLTSLINRRQIAVGKAAHFYPRIDELRQERSKLSTFERGDVIQVKAPVPGFFSKYCDGYEALISPSMLPSMNITDYIGLIERPPPSPPPGRAGRIVRTGIWYMAVPLDLFHSEWLRKGQQIELEFEQLFKRIPATVHDIKYENNSDTMVAIFKSDHMSAEIINFRVTEVTVYSAQHSGLRINTSALYFRERTDGVAERGVYVLVGNTVRFKLVYPVYEEAAYLLSDPNPTAPVAENPDDPDAGSPTIPPPVKKYDLIITRGTDLYDGKPIQ